MTCLKCGYKFEEGIFCPECGTKYEEGYIRVETEEKRQEEKKIHDEIERREKIKEIDEQEKMRQDELSRTFNGVLYNSIDDMNEAKIKYEKQVAYEKEAKKIDTKAIWSFALSIVVWPLTITVILWFPVLIVSIILGVTAMKEKTSKKELVITGFVINGILVLFIALSILSNRRLSQVISADCLRRKYLSQSAVNELKAFCIGWYCRLSRVYFSSDFSGLK